MELYAEIRSRIEGRPVSPSAGQAVLRNLYVAPTMETARREAEAPILSAFVYNDPVPRREVFTNPGEELQPGTKLIGTFLSRETSSSDRPSTSPSGSHELAEVCRARVPARGARAPGIPQRLILRNLELSRRR